MELNLQGKKVLITGGAQGIGLAMVRNFLSESCEVHSLDLNAAQNGAQHSVVDVTDSALLQKKIMDLNPDILVNNAGIAVNKLMPKFSIDDFDRVLSINVTSILVASQAFFKVRKKTGGVIINVASILGLIGAPLGAAYGASKGAVVSLTRSLAVEGARSNIRVNSICPGMVDTDMSKAVKKSKAMFAANLAMIPMGRFAHPEEIADLALYLASDKANYVTGQNIAIDGGYTAR
jgi:NAD(P)-dependent dehydrogenase (short-subunit alcohol dehydrogenase family)